MHLKAGGGTPDGIDEIGDEMFYGKSRTKIDEDLKQTVMRILRPNVTEA